MLNVNRRNLRSQIKIEIIIKTNPKTKEKTFLNNFIVVIIWLINFTNKKESSSLHVPTHKFPQRPKITLFGFQKHQIY